MGVPAKRSVADEVTQSGLSSFEVLDSEARLPDNVGERGWARTTVFIMINFPCARLRGRVKTCNVMTVRAPSGSGHASGL